MRSATVTAAGMLAFAVMVVACSSGTIGPLPVGPPPASLDQFPPCDVPQQPQDPPSVVDGPAPLPPGAFLIASEEVGPLTEASGWAPGNVAELRRFYEERVPAGWQPMTLENELVEAEILLARDETRFFVQAVARCQDGLDLYVRVIQSPS